MRKICFVFLLLAAFITPTFAANGDDGLKKGNELVQSGNLDGAIDAYRKAAASAPKNAKIHLALGLALANKGNSLEAAGELRKSAEIEPTYQAWYSLGLVYVNQNVFDKAIDAYKRAIGLNSRGYKAWYQLGLAHQANGEFGAAVEAFGNSAKFNPSYPEAYLGYASASYWAGDVAAARYQVARLRSLKFPQQADALESWIAAKEKRKAEGAPAAVPVPPPASE